MSRYKPSSGSWEHMPVRRPWLERNLGALLLGIMIVFMAIIFTSTLPYAACLGAGGTSEECRNAGSH